MAVLVHVVYAEKFKLRFSAAKTFAAVSIYNTLLPSAGARPIILRAPCANFLTGHRRTTTSTSFFSVHIESFLIQGVVMLPALFAVNFAFAVSMFSTLAAQACFQSFGPNNFRPVFGHQFFLYTFVSKPSAPSNSPFAHFGTLVMQ